MTETSKQWEGQVVDEIFPLRQYLGGSDHSAVFLTEHAEGESKKAAIKLIPAEPASAEAQLASWETASQLSHPNLLRLINAGRCKLGGNDLLYLVMEFAEEDLSQILPQRGLIPEETREVLCAAADALDYLHTKGFVHGDLKPSNILASGDRLKLSSDSISRTGAPPNSSRRSGAYDPPEAINGVLTPAGDVWSLGSTLVEVLTQRRSEWQPGAQLEPVVPATIPAPFSEIARQCLRLEPQRRISIADIAARLNSPAPAPVPASVSASAPVAGSKVRPLAAVAIKPASHVSVPPRAAARLQSNPHRPEPYRGSGSRSRFIVPLTLGALAFGLILTVPRLLTHHKETQTAPAVKSEKPSGQSGVQKSVAPTVSPKRKSEPEHVQVSSETAKVATPPSHATAQGTAKPTPPESLKTASAREQPSSGIAKAPVSRPTEAAPTPPARISARGEVLDQVMPDVSQKARGTIRGKVRVSIKVQVDPSGTVSGAELDSAGPSAFFADLALKAARRWAFTPPEVGGKSMASEWRLKFEFTQTDTRVTPIQTLP